MGCGEESLRDGEGNCISEGVEGGAVQILGIG